RALSPAAWTRSSAISRDPVNEIENRRILGRKPISLSPKEMARVTASCSTEIFAPQGNRSTATAFDRVSQDDSANDRKHHDKYPRILEIDHHSSGGLWNSPGGFRWRAGWTAHGHRPCRRRWRRSWQGSRQERQSRRTRG